MLLRFEQKKEEEEEKVAVIFSIALYHKYYIIKHNLCRIKEK